MSRGKGFKRPERPERDAPAPLRPISRGVVVSCAGIGSAIPKESVCHSSTYEVRVRKLACRRCGVVGFSQFCHTDEGKGTGIKTDVRLGWAGCGPRTGVPGCHHEVGTSGTIPRALKRDLEKQYAASTRAEILQLNQWPVRLPRWVEEGTPA
jgi:hypothetical protein